MHYFLPEGLTWGSAGLAHMNSLRTRVRDDWDGTYWQKADFGKPQVAADGNSSEAEDEETDFEEGPAAGGSQPYTKMCTVGPVNAAFTARE